MQPRQRMQRRLLKAEHTVVVAARPYRHLYASPPAQPIVLPVKKKEPWKAFLTREYTQRKTKPKQPQELGTERAGLLTTMHQADDHASGNPFSSEDIESRADRTQQVAAFTGCT